MKKAIVAITATISLTTGVTAHAGDSAEKQHLVQEVCAIAYDAAEMIMRQRQNNAPMPRLLASFNKSDDPDWNESMTAIVTSAYKVPRFSVESNQMSAVRDFANKLYLDCVEVLSKHVEELSK